MYDASVYRAYRRVTRKKKRYDRSRSYDTCYGLDEVSRSVEFFFFFFLLFVFKATSRETRVSDVTLTVPNVQASLLLSSFFLPNYHVLHSVADVDVTFQKCNRENRLSASSTERTFFLTFPRAPPRFPPLPAYVASTENALDCTISFLYLPFPFYFYFTHVYVHTHTHTLHAL